jgi:hypothetical protein
VNNELEENQMKPSTKLAAALVWTVWIGSIALGIVFFIAAGAFFRDSNRDLFPPSRAISNARKTLAAFVASQTPDLIARGSVTRYLTGFADDRSLDVATAAEQVRTGYVRYSVRLQVSSGAEQSIDVTGPPGGLRTEVRDMTGDGVRNDLVLTPALIHWPLTVLVNDGHDHFAVVVSGDLPGSLGDGKDRASGNRDVPNSVALISSRFKADYPALGERQFLSQLQESVFSPATIGATVRLGRACSSGRAPPRV